MINAIAHARYIFALASGEMTDEIRGLFLGSIEDGDEQAVFTELMEVYSKRVVEGSDAQTELASLEAEYTALGLMDTLGAYSTYEPVITAAISTINENIGGLERCQTIAAAADTITSEAVRAGIYLAILRHITAAHLILADEALATKAIEQVEGKDEAQIQAGALTSLVDMCLSQSLPWSQAE